MARTSQICTCPRFDSKIPEYISQPNIQPVNYPLKASRNFKKEIQDFDQQEIFNKSGKFRRKRLRMRRSTTTLSTIDECDIVDIE